jgi:hypothetical protein
MAPTRSEINGNNSRTHDLSTGETASTYTACYGVLREGGPELARFVHQILDEIGLRPSLHYRLASIDKRLGFISGNMRWEYREKLPTRRQRKSVKLAARLADAKLADARGVAVELARDRLAAGALQACLCDWSLEQGCPCPWAAARRYQC